MGEYSIKELEKLSGIKAHTIRIWEKRYQLITPKRTPTNIRFYSDEDLKKIINVAIANNSGVKISRLARLSVEEINQLVHKQNEFKNEMASPVDNLVLTTVEMNEPAFITVLSKLQKQNGFEKTVINVLYPFLEKIGIMWHTGEITPAQEHFVSNLIRQKIMVAIDSLPYPSGKKPKAVLFLPENEFHEIGLLFYNYLTRKMGHRTIYLGQSVPHSDLKQVVKVHQPEMIITSMVTTLNDDKIDDYIQRLSRDFKNKTILISGMATQKFDFSRFPNIRQFSSAQALKSLL